MADDLVDDVGLGGVERLARVPEVLGGVEGAAAQVGVELAQRHQPGGGAVAPAGERVQPLGDLVQLRHVVGGQREGGLGREELGVRVLLVLGCELGRHQAPDAVLLVGVLDGRHRLAGSVRERRGRDLAASGAVVGIGEAGVVLPQVHLHLTVGVGRHGRVELSFLEHRAHLLVSCRGLVGLSPHDSTFGGFDGTAGASDGQRAHSFTSGFAKGLDTLSSPPRTHRRATTNGRARGPLPRGLAPRLPVAVPVSPLVAPGARPPGSRPAGGCRAARQRVGWAPDTQ